MPVLRFSKPQISDGTVTLLVEEEFSVVLRLALLGEASLTHQWQLLNVNILVASADGQRLRGFTERHQQKLMEELQQRLLSEAQPIQFLYSVLHETCVKLAFYSVLYVQARYAHMLTLECSCRF